MSETATQPTGPTNVEDVEEAMRDVVDPELGINVVDLGLVYGVHIDDDNAVTLDMTLTSAACPLTDVIEDQTNQAMAEHRQQHQDQLGLDATVGAGQDHRRGSRAAAGAGLQRLTWRVASSAAWSRHRPLHSSAVRFSLTVCSSPCRRLCHTSLTCTGCVRGSACPTKIAPVVLRLRMNAESEHDGSDLERVRRRAPSPHVPKPEGNASSPRREACTVQP